MKLDSRIKCALITWSLCVALALCIFGGLRLASADKLLQADIRVVDTLESSDQAHHYTAKLIFSNPIFRAHKDAVAITIHSIDWDLAKTPRFTHPSPDSNRLELISQSPLELGSHIGTLTYSAKILATSLQTALKWLTFALIVWFVLVFGKKLARELDATHPKHARIAPYSLLDSTAQSLQSLIFGGGGNIQVSPRLLAGTKRFYALVLCLLWGFLFFNFG